MINGDTSYLKSISTIKKSSKIRGTNLTEDKEYKTKTNLKNEDKIKNGSNIGAFSFINGKLTNTKLSGKFNICGYYIDIKEIDITSELTEENNYLYLKMNTANDVSNNISNLRINGIDRLLPGESLENSEYTGIEIIGTKNIQNETTYKKYLKLAEKKNGE